MRRGDSVPIARGQILIVVASGTSHRRRASAVPPARHALRMVEALVVLQRGVTRNVAIPASGVLQHGADDFECSQSAVR